MGKLKAKSDYENLRNARVLENQARLASLGLHKTISDLREVSLSANSKTQKREYKKRVYGVTPLRRSQRLRGTTVRAKGKHLSLRRSDRLIVKSGNTSSSQEVDDSDEEDKESFSSGGERKRPANAPLVKIKGSDLQISSEASGRRCNSSGRGRGSVYDPVFGICCHFCRQKKLCGEKDCKRCCNFDTDEPCLGKTDCSVCHSSNGVFCRACLKVRYGEEMEKVRENKGWMCPHCIEEKGIKPYWICNSSLCLRKRKIAPTGIAIYRAWEMGYKSVAHLLMDELKCANKI